MSQSEPIACGLSATAQADQSTRWVQLIGTSATARIATADGVRIELTDDSAVDSELRALVAVERNCCSWATWTVTREARALVLFITSSTDGAAALRAMFQA